MKIQVFKEGEVEEEYTDKTLEEVIDIVEKKRMSGIYDKPVTIVVKMERKNGKDSA